MINLKKTPLIFLFFTSISLNLYSFNEKEEFYITCKVVDQVVMSIEDGQSKKFSGIEDGLKEGEVFNINFSFSIIDPQYYNFEVDNDKLLMQISMNSEDLDMGLVFTEGQINHKRGSTQRTIFSKEYILLEDLLGMVVLKRYYKNDWQLIYNLNTSFDNYGHLLVANCMGVTDRYNTMVNRMLDIYERN